MDPVWRWERFQELSLNNLYAILRLRQEVFVIEQECQYQDLDNKDLGAHHLWCAAGDDLLAYLRCLPPGEQSDYSKLGRIVIAPAARGTGLGKELVARGIKHNFAQWPDTDIKIGAQAHLQRFYEEYGFVTVSEVYDEDGIPHIDMVLRA